MTRRRNNPQKPIGVIPAPRNLAPVAVQDGNGHRKVEMTRAELFSGPLPHPDIFAGYGNIIPDAPERILKMAEQEMEHRQGLEKWLVKGDVIRSFIGVIIAGLLGGGIIYAGVYLVMHGCRIEGTVFAGFGLAAIIGVFVYGTRIISKEKKE
jgi:uncharacterized membrane protein